ncbi:MAG: hypothetical protein ACOX69_06455 [Coriobacteriales bacterium]|jgi:hypothetical protein
MGENDEIIANTKTIMAMEGMELSDDDLETLRECLDGSKSFDEAVSEAVSEHKAA